jgi:hypothetical protein
LPILLWVLYRTRQHDLLWRLTWTGFFAFALLIIGYNHFGFGNYVASVVATWYFEAAIGIPVCLMVAATARSAARRDTIDWWTAITVIAIASVWCIGIANKLLA